MVGKWLHGSEELSEATRKDGELLLGKGPIHPTEEDPTAVQLIVHWNKHFPTP